MYEFLAQQMMTDEAKTASSQEGSNKGTRDVPYQTHDRRTDYTGETRGEKTQAVRETHILESHPE